MDLREITVVMVSSCALLCLIALTAFVSQGFRALRAKLRLRTAVSMMRCGETANAREQILAAVRLDRALLKVAEVHSLYESMGTPSTSAPNGQLASDLEVAIEKLPAGRGELVARRMVDQLQVMATTKRTRIFVPAIGLILVNSVFFLYRMYFLVRVRPHSFDLTILLLLLYELLAAGLAGLAVAGGGLMLVRRHYRFCFSAIICSMVGGLLGGVLIVLILPVSIWALLVLRSSDGVAAFEISPLATPDRMTLPVVRFVALCVVFLAGLAAAYAYLAMIGFGVAMSGAGAGSVGYQSTWRLGTWLYCLPAVSFLLVSAACLPLLAPRTIKFLLAASLLALCPVFLVGDVFLAAQSALGTVGAFAVILACRLKLGVERLAS